jgi:hypothetical protein
MLLASQVISRLRSALQRRRHRGVQVAVDVVSRQLHRSNDRTDVQACRHYLPEKLRCLQAYTCHYHCEGPPPFETSFNRKRVIFIPDFPD